MKYLKKELFIPITLISIILLSTGCASKNANGSYVSAYSYHPYLKRKPTKTSYALIQTKQITPHYYQQRTIKKVFKPNTYKLKPLKKQSYPILLSKKTDKPYAFRPTHAMAQNIEKSAKSLLGTKYVYGATGPYQYDCSGFTQHVFAKQGITLPRVSKDQAQRGQYVSVEELQKGDLIFFDSKKSSKVSHVGIYLEDGNFIHASSAQHKVTISNLRSNYYSKHFKWGRRVTQASYAMR